MPAPSLPFCQVYLSVSMDPKEDVPLRFPTFKPYRRKMVIAYTLRDGREVPLGLMMTDEGAVQSSDTDAEVLGEFHPFFSLPYLYHLCFRNQNVC
ncbi:hypothetical protein PG993_008884 [Apiospora rasikravindrae]|uniref:Uncharacterized protein n=1 Tax=Apiospora rasikravindrae TaxID=990691 RepID=A0ABR1SPK8_9PEZI